MAKYYVTTWFAKKGFKRNEKNPNPINHTITSCDKTHKEARQRVRFNRRYFGHNRFKIISSHY